MEKLLSGTATVPGSKVTLVNNQNPLAEMVRINAEALGIPPGSLFDSKAEGWMPVDSSIVDRCLARYEEEVRIGFQDMRNFEIRFSRVDSFWNDPVGVCDNIARRAKNGPDHVDNTRLQNIYELEAEIDMRHVLYGQGEQVTQ